MRTSLTICKKIAVSLMILCSFTNGMTQINTGIITANATGCEGLTNYSSGGENHRIYYYPGSSTASSQTPATLTATSPNGGLATFVWMKFVIDLTNPRNGWQQVQIDQGVSSSNLANQGLGAYLVYVYDASGNFLDYDLCWVLITRLQPTQLPSVNITNNTTDCNGPNTINATTTGTVNGLIIAPATTPYSYAEPPPLPLIVNSSSSISVNFQGTQATSVTQLVFGLEGPTSCNNPLVYFGSVPDFSGPGTGTFNTAGCSNSTAFSFDFTFSNIPGSIYSACNISNGTNGTNDIYYANPSGTANPNPTEYDFSPFFGCDATNGDWTFRVWKCAAGGGGILISEMTATINGGYAGPASVATTENIIGLSPSDAAASLTTTTVANCGNTNFGLSRTSPETVITPETCAANGYEWQTDPEFILPANAVGSINNGPQLQSLVLNNPLSDVNGPLTYWQNFEVTLSITNVCHQTGIDNGCFGASLQDVQMVNLAPSAAPNLIAIPALCIVDDAEDLIANVPGVWTGNGVTLSGSTYQFDPALSGTGNHTLTFNPDDPCYSQTTMNVQVDDIGTNPPNFIIPPNTGYCLNASPVDLTTYVPESGTWGGQGVNPATGQFDPSANFPGPVTISFIPDNGCPDLVQQSVTVYPIPTVAIDQGISVNFCQGASITLDASGANTYTWTTVSGVANITSPNASSTLITPSQTSNILIEGTESTNNCTNTATVQLIQVANEIPSINPSQSFCENANPLALVGQLSGGIISTNGTWSGTGVVGNEFVPSAANLGVNTVTYDIPDNPAAGDCYSPATSNFTVNSIPTFSASTSDDATICAGDNHPLNAAINEAGNPSFAWSPATGLDDANIATPIATLSSSETYQVTAINSGCSATQTIVITVIPVETPVITGVDTFCTNGLAYTFQSTLPGGTWSSIPANASLTNAGDFTPAMSPTGNYTFTYTPTGQCQLPNTVDVVVESPPIVDAGLATTICVNATPLASMQGTATNAITTEWSPSTYLTNSASLTTTINPTAAGSQQYTLTATGAGGCVASSVVNLTFQDIFTPVIDPIGPFCTTDAQQVLTVNSSNGSWYIDGVIEPTGLLTPSLINTPSVIVSYDPETTCSTPAELEVFFSAPGDFVFAPEPDVCINDAAFNLLDLIDFAASFDNVDGVITNTNLGTFNPATAGAGTYNIICEVNDVCQLTLNQNITVHAPVIDVTDEQICFNIATTLQAPVENPAGVYTYQWTPATFLNNATLETPIITFADTLNYPTGVTYTVTGTDAYGCEASDTKHITVFPAPYITTETETIVCPFAEVVLHATCTPGNITWSPATGVVSDGNTASPIVSVGATTLFTASLTDINCPDIAVESFVQLPVEAIYNLYAGPDTYFCEYTSVYITANPGGANPDYFWSTTDGTLGADSLSTHMQVADEGTYTFNVTTPLGCIYEDDVFVDEVPLPVGTAPDTSFLCLGEILILNAGAWDSVVWDIGQTSATLPVTSPGLYPHEIFQDGCSSRDTFLVTQVVLPYFDLGPDRKFCTGDTIFIAAEVAGEWNTGEIDSVITVTEEGDYVMSVADGSCIRVDSIYVDEIQLPSSNLPAEVIGCEGEGTVLDAFSPDIEEYYWSTGDTSSSIVVYDIDDYNVRISNYCGTAYYDTHAGLEICSHTIFIPNSFTPDGDDINDYWRVYANNISSIDITIVNRFGETVFKSNNAEKVWLGDKNESRYYLENGIYFYTILFKDENGDTQKMTGNINLMR